MSALDQYWTVATNPTQRWAGARGQYVATSDSDCVAWLAASLDNTPVSIATEALLFQEINRIALSIYIGSGPSYSAVSLGSNTALTSLATITEVTPSSAGFDLTLPQANLP